MTQRPRLLFKGGTSLSKAFGLISRFSEDIDITVFRDDLGQAAEVAELDALSGKMFQMQFTARVIERHAVQQHERASALSAARVYLRERASPAIIGYLQTGDVAQDVGQHRIIQRLQLTFGNNAG